MSSDTTLPGVAPVRATGGQIVRRGLALSPAIRDGLWLTLLLAVLSTVGGSVVPVVIQRTIDSGLGDGGTTSLSAIGPYLLGALVLVLLTAVVAYWMRVRLFVASERGLAELRVTAFRHVHDLSMLTQNAERRGALVSRVTSDVDQVSLFLQFTGITIVISIGQMLVATIIMAFYSWQLTLVVWACFLPLVMSLKFFAGRLSRAYDTVRRTVGEMLAVVAEPVVGETGSGKTTFAKLLTRLMDPTRGTVRLGDTDITQVAFDDLRRHVLMVPQEGFLFDATLRENLRYGRRDASDEVLLATVADLGLTDWFATLPRGLDTPVGQRGESLSAGERQLVALVRSALADPDFLVLDEATSAVDPQTELRATRALETLLDGRTSVTIAHRLTTAENADRVLVFDAGRLVEDGSHAALVEAGGVYARLHASWVAQASLGIAPVAD